MTVKISIRIDTDAGITLDKEQLKIIQGEMYTCCTALENLRIGDVSCKPLKADDIAVVGLGN